VIPTYFDEKRYSYQVLATRVSWVSAYQQTDPTTGLEIQIQRQYAVAYDSLKQGRYAAALDAFRQLQNLILTSVHPTLPVTSYLSPQFVAPMDVSLIDVFASRAASVLQTQPIPTYTFPGTLVADAAAFPAPVAATLASFQTAGLKVSAAQLQLTATITQAYSAAGANDWAGASTAFTTALGAVPDTQPGMRAAIMQDLAIATEKSGGAVQSAVAMAQSSADLFGTAALYDAQVGALTTLAGIQERANDAAGSASTLAAATTVQTQNRLFPVVVAPPITLSSITVPLSLKTTGISPVMTTVSAARLTPVATAPVVSAPIVTTPVVTAPIVTAPIVTTPVVTAPIVTTPVTTTATATTLTANLAPELISASYLATLPPDRTYTLAGATASASLALTGDLVANVHGFLQTITATTDVSLLLGAVRAADSTQMVAYLPSMYFFVIPMAIGDCLMGLGSLEEAVSTYAGVLVYPYINTALEIPKLWNKLAAAYLAMGDRDYRNAADDATQFPTAVADYEHIINTDDTLDATSPLYADARFADIKARVTAFAAAGFPATHPDNPELLAKVSEARLRLQQIKSGLDFFGLAIDYLPPFSWEYLQNTAKYFAQQAAQMEQRYIQYTTAGADETLQRQELDQQAGVAAQTVVLEQRGLDEANAAVAEANAGLNYTQVQQNNAQAAQADFANNRDALAEYDELEAWANAASVDQGSEVSLTISNYTYYNTSGERRSLVIQDLETAREKISQDMEASSLQRNADAAKAYAAQAQAQVAEAQTQVAIANQRIALAQLQQRDAEENRDYLDMQEFNAQLWFELAGNAQRIMQRYTDMATAVALLAQRAYNAETGRNLNVIRGDYTHSATDNLMGADFLSLDLDTFTYDYVTTTKTKKAPVKRIISLADAFPYSFNLLRTTGHCSFQTELAMFDRQTPGMYLCEIRNVELVFVGVTQVSLAGSLRNVGASRFRQADGTVVTRLYPADVMPLSAYEIRQDALAFRVNPNDLQLFENNGVDTLWQLDMPFSANDIDFGSIIDVQLVLYYDGFFDPGLETKIIAGLPTSAAATRVTSMRLTFPDELFYLKGQGQAELTYDETLFPRTQTKLKRAKSSLRVSGDAATTNGLTLSIASTATGATYKVKTDANGVVAGTAAADPLSVLNGSAVFDTLMISISAADNPALVSAGKLNLTGLTDLMTYFEYTFDYR
jgi:hypothetical protein